MTKVKLIKNICEQKAKMAVLMGLLVVTPFSFAVPPYTPDFVTNGNRWSFKNYDDEHPDQLVLASAQIVCFERAGTLGNHMQYTFYSESFPGWRGRAVQEGDQLYMHGDYADGQGHNTIQLDSLVATTPPNVNGSAGMWQEWRSDGKGGSTVKFAKTRALREGNCTLTAAQAAKQAPLMVGDPVTTDVVP